MASAAGSLFARLYAGHTGVDPYTTAVSDTYQDLFDEGIFTGKGLYDVDAFVGRSRIACRRTRCCRTTCSRGCTRARRSSPTSKSSTTIRRACSRTPSASTGGCAATGRSCWWLLPFVPTRAGWRRNRLPLIARWKIFDNLRRSLMAPATVALLLAGWTVLPGSPVVWTAIGLAAIGVPGGRRACRADRHAGEAGPLARRVRGPADGGGPRGVAGRVSRQRRVRPAARHHRDARPRRVHAPAPARMGDSGRRVQPRRVAARRRVRTADDGEPDRRGGRACRRRRRAIRAPCRRRFRWSAAWVAAPAIAFVLSRPASSRREVLDADDRAFLRRVALETWRYFDTFMGAEDHALPPDNVQMARRRASRIARRRRTSRWRCSRPSRRTTWASSTWTTWSRGSTRR